MVERATPALGALTAVNVPKLPGVRKPNQFHGKGQRRSYHTYTDLERVSALILMAAVGVRDACNALDVPERTMRRWVAEAGGIDGLSNEVGKALGVTRYAVALKVCQAIVDRLTEFTPSELLDALRALAAGATHPDAQHLDQPAAPAQVVVMVGSDRIPLPASSDTPSPVPEVKVVEGTAKRLPDSAS